MVMFAVEIKVLPINDWRAAGPVWQRADTDSIPMLAFRARNHGRRGNPADVREGQHLDAMSRLLRLKGGGMPDRPRIIS